MNDCIEAFGLIQIPEITAPLARDYIKFNSQRDMFDPKAAGPLFDFTKGATRET